MVKKESSFIFYKDFWFRLIVDIKIEEKLKEIKKAGAISGLVARPRLEIKLKKTKTKGIFTGMPATENNKYIKFATLFPLIFFATILF